MSALNLNALFAGLLFITMLTLSSCSILSLRIGGNRNRPLSPFRPTETPKASMGSTAFDFPTQRFNSYPAEAENEGSGNGDYLEASQVHPNTRLGVWMCPRVENRIRTSNGGVCPRGWIGFPGCTSSDLRNLGRCEWESEVDIELPNRWEKFRGMLCDSRRMGCLNQAGVFPGNTQLIHAPKNSLFDPSELAETLSNLKGLAAIDLSRNNFRTLSPKTFTKNHCLRSVNFDLNFLLDIPQLIFAANHQLASVSFVGNKLDYLPPRIFYFNRFLSIVNFERNNITLIPPEVFRRNPRLTVIRLSGNSIQKIPGGLFSSHPNLREVYLAHNRISAVPKALFKSTKNLRTLYLGGNRIRKLPATLFENCRELRTLTLDRNLITTLPTRLFENNKKLIHIDLSYNKFHVVDPNIFANNRYVTIVNHKWSTHTVKFEEEETEGTLSASPRTPNTFRKLSLRLK